MQVFARELHPLELLGQHGKVELRGVESCEVAVLEPLRHLVRDLVESGLVPEHVVGDAVDFRRLGVHRTLAFLLVVPGLDAPGPDLVFSAGEYLDEAELHYGVGRYVESCALDVEEEQGTLEIQFHAGVLYETLIGMSMPQSFPLSSSPSAGTMSAARYESANLMTRLPHPMLESISMRKDDLKPMLRSSPEYSQSSFSYAARANPRSCAVISIRFWESLKIICPVA